VPRARQVCSRPGCPELAPCRLHDERRDRLSARNHRGVPRQARGHGAAYDAWVRAHRGEPCALRLPGCTGEMSGGNYTRPGDWTSPLEPACSHCQSVQGGRLAAPAR
jgi:hypothetical protein